MLGSTVQHQHAFSSSYSKKERWQVFNQKSTYNSVENIADVRANQHAAVQGGSAEGVRATRPEREKYVPDLEATGVQAQSWASRGGLETYSAINHLLGQ